MKPICKWEIQQYKKQKQEKGVLTATGDFRAGEEMSQVTYSHTIM